MNYRKRLLEDKVKKYQGLFPALLVTGARQVGKSTLLTHLFGKTHQHIVFDPVTDFENARQDPEFFLQQHPAPLILDEIQYAPQLLPLIKKRIDRDRTPGQFLLTGSQNLALLKTVSESMAGRVAVLDLETMGLAERLDAVKISTHHSWLEEIFLAKKVLPKIQVFRRLRHQKPFTTLFDILWRGGYPGTLELPGEVLADYFQSYIRTYVERDIRALAEISDQQLFTRFCGLAAALTAQEINHSQFGREIGITPQTASRWLSILKATYQWLEIPPYHGNSIKKISGKGKGYLTDTGLLCYLLRVSSTEALASLPLLGAIFETHVVMEIKRLCSATATPPHLYHWRCHSGAEVDLVLERDGILWPIEIKCKTQITRGDLRGIEAFQQTYPEQCGFAIVIASIDEAYFFNERVLVLPYDLS
ncbi:MAG: ATP-binding protein [Candidatus Omnitrophica bacterium]|nr:ATP-binding protein [Candidatus Omnitrophota bacterium]